MDRVGVAGTLPAQACLEGEGEVAACMRTLDWSATPLGPLEDWSLGLQNAVRILLGARQPMCLMWGPQQAIVYNDACRTTVIGHRHPHALGQPAAEVWPDHWAHLLPRVQQVLATGRPAAEDALLLLLGRTGRREETYHTVSFCPQADDEGRIAGVLCISNEDTRRVVQQRRMHCLREVAALGGARLPAGALPAALAQVLAAYARDLPFALAYHFDEHGKAADLVFAAGLASDHPAAPARILAGRPGAPWPVDAVRHGGCVLVGVEQMQGLPNGGWLRPPRNAAVAAWMPRGGQQAAGFLVVGLNPYRRWGEAYQDFVNLLADQVCTLLEDARWREGRRPEAPAARAPSLLPGGGSDGVPSAPAPERPVGHRMRAASAPANSSADEVEGLKRLYEFSSRLLAINGLQPLLEEVLEATMALHGADFGVVHQVEPQSGDLLLVAQRNLPEAHLARFRRMNDPNTISGRAVRRMQRVIIEDVLDDAAFVPFRPAAATLGFRAAQSTPLVSRKGEVLGVISTQFRTPRRFSGHELRFTDLYARQAADIVERNRAEEALRASEERFRRYFDLGLVGLALSSPARGMLEVNEEMCRIVGYPREELLGMQWTEITHPEDVAADLVQFEGVLAGAHDGYMLEKRFMRKDGRPVWCAMSVQCMRGPDGTVDCFVALVQDMTERLGAEDALRRARDQLAHVARVAAMGELAASIAHEVNQPLAAIVANGHAVSRWLAAGNPGEARAAIERIIADGHRASQVIGRIRSFVRREEPRREMVDVQELLRDVAAMLDREARARGVRMQVEADGGPLQAVGDRVQLEQVVLNLVMNGFDAMATVPPSRRRLCMRAVRESPDMLRVSVKDAGVGVAAAERDRIFDAFTTSKPGGMGMGLAISRSIVEAHAGRLWCAPNEAGGETFSFSLPG